MTVAEWVRQALRKAREDEPALEPRRKLAVVREAARHGYPTGDTGERLVSDINALQMKTYCAILSVWDVRLSPQVARPPRPTWSSPKRS